MKDSRAADRILVRLADAGIPLRRRSGPESYCFICHLRAAGCGPREVSPGRWRASCPGHDDPFASLVVRRDPDEDGAVIFDCVEGCQLHELLDTLDARQPTEAGLRRCREVFV